MDNPGVSRMSVEASIARAKVKVDCLRHRRRHALPRKRGGLLSKCDIEQKDRCCDAEYRCFIAASCT
jgi:hypothetical protein